MKQLTCEMCGSTELLKQDGVFVCQTCGTKYTVEEAKKMMVEGTVDVSGSTIKIDTSGELDNLYQIARRAKDDNNGENAAKYYDMILLKDPTSWEASFYVVYFKAMECKIAQIRSAAISVSNCEDSVLTLIKDNVPENEQAAAVKEVMLRSSLIANMLANGAKNHYEGIDSDIKGNYTQEYIDNACAARDVMYICGSQIDRIFGEIPEIGKFAADAWKSGIEMHTQILPYFANKEKNKELMISYVEKIGKYDSEYANNYVNLEKKKILKDEIVKLEANINAVAASKKQSKEITVGTGIFFAVLGCFFFVRALPDLSYDSYDSTGIFVFLLCGLFMCVGLLTIIWGICKGQSAKQIEKNKQEKIASLKSQIEAKQAELDSLKI